MAAGDKYLPSKVVAQGVMTAVNLVLIGVAVSFILRDNRGLRSVGMVGGNWKTSVLVGLACAAVLFFFNCAIFLLRGYSLIDGKSIVLNAAVYLIVALCEELVFRGYIGTRLYGVLKRQWLTAVITGALFVLMHYCYPVVSLLASGVPISELATYNFGGLRSIADRFVTHLVFTIIYAKTDSLYGAIIPHWISNLAFYMVAR
jgi:membrane protease YdiL (CAAX protease family)